jgi:DnaJ-class molecular chaperone
LKGRGLAGSAGNRGDLYVEVQIEVPKKLSDRERKLWTELAELHSDNT